MSLIRRHAAPRLRGVRGFSVLEVAVSVGILLVVSAVIAWSVAAAYSVKGQAVTFNKLTQALAYHLDDVTDVPLPDLLAGTFTVPEPCDLSSQDAGFAGKTCAQIGNLNVTIGYSVANPVLPSPTCEGTQSAQNIYDTHGVLPVKACVLFASSSQFHQPVTTDTWQLSRVAPQVRTVGVTP